jgi:hypothetical protein
MLKHIDASTLVNFPLIGNIPDKSRDPHSALYHSLTRIFKMRFKRISSLSVHPPLPTLAACEVPVRQRLQSIN